jgi:putative ABC transport system substrate-binding protein
MFPQATIIALLVDPTNPSAETPSRDVQAAAHTLGLQLHGLRASTERNFDTVFANLAQGRAGALMIGTEGLLISRSQQLAAPTVHHAIPTSSRLVSTSKPFWRRL